MGSREQKSLPRREGFFVSDDTGVASEAAYGSRKPPRPKTLEPVTDTDARRDLGA
jgi:hypothetical protein